MIQVRLVVLGFILFSFIGLKLVFAACPNIPKGEEFIYQCGDSRVTLTQGNRPVEVRDENGSSVQPIYGYFFRFESGEELRTVLLTGDRTQCQENPQAVVVNSRRQGNILSTARFILARDFKRLSLNILQSKQTLSCELTRIEKSAQSGEKRKKPASAGNEASTDADWACAKCGVMETLQRRWGFNSQGERVRGLLCNTCGLRLSKKVNNEAQQREEVRKRMAISNLIEESPEPKKSADQK